MKFIGNLSEKKWKIEHEEDYADEIIIDIGFTEKEKDVIFFKNLSFGINLKSKDIDVSYYFPDKNVSYESTDQEIIESMVFNVLPLQTYDIDIWVENDGEKFSDKTSIETSLIKKPYPSWTWNEEEEMYEPPIPVPDDKVVWQWDEDFLKWVKVSEILTGD